MRLRDMSIKWRLMALCILLIVIPLLFVGALSYKSSKREIYSSVEQKLREQVVMIANHLESTIELTQKKVNSDLKVAHETLYSFGVPVLNDIRKIRIHAIDQMTHEERQLEIPAMMLGEKQIAHNYAIVDKIQQLVGGTATIFQAIPGGILRISTNVLKADGSRAVGTYIPSDSPVYQTVMNGDTFYGRAYVVNAWYQTAYEPIRDRRGTIIGVLYVGVEEASAAILDDLAQLVVGKTGYILILNTQGEYVLSYKRRRDGESIFNTRDSEGRLFVQDWVKNGSGLEKGKSRIDYYPWMNEGEKAPRLKIIAYSYFPAWEWIIGSTTYVEDFTDSLQQIRKITLVVSGIAILAGSIVAYMFASALVMRFKQVISQLHELAQGNLTLHIPTDRQDEIGLLFASLREMLVKQRDIVAHLKDAAQKLASTSQAVSASSEEMSQGANSQASVTEEVSSSMQQMVANIRQNAENAKQTEKIAIQATEDADQSGQAVQENFVAMQAIAKTISLIEEISAQTRLLSLNATIEASKAQEHGKGFAVVAAEVRELAERSREAAEEIKALADSGVTIARTTENRLTHLVPDIRRTAELVQDIRSASDEQHSGAEQISRSVQQLNQVIQQNAGISEELAAMAETLNEQAEQLQRSIDFFRLDDSV